MPGKSLADKLNIKSGMRIVVINAPEGYIPKLGELPGGVELERMPKGKYDLVHLFAMTSQELAQLTPMAFQALHPDGSIWISYPKRSAKIETDLTRDQGWASVRKAGWRPVAQISIDAVWSALRFRVEEAVSDTDKIEAQYDGKKEGLRPIFERLLEVVEDIGPDVEVSPRKTYVSLIRSKQFAVIQASTAQRLDVGLRLKGIEITPRLQAAGSFGSGSITHKVSLTRIEDVDRELIRWLRDAYEGISPDRGDG